MIKGIRTRRLSIQNSLTVKVLHAGSEADLIVLLFHGGTLGVGLADDVVQLVDLGRLPRDRLLAVVHLVQCVGVRFCEWGSGVRVRVGVYRLQQVMRYLNRL